MKHFATSLTAVFLLFFVTACEKETPQPTPTPEPEKWVVADLDIKSSWLKVAQSDDKLFILNRLELMTLNKDGKLESQYPLPVNDILDFGIGKEVFFWTTYEGTNAFLNVAPNNNPSKARKLSLNVFGNKSIYRFNFRNETPEAGYFNNQNQLLFLGSSSDSLKPYFSLTIDVALNADKSDFVDCRVVNKNEFAFPRWSLNALRQSTILDDRIYICDKSSTMRIDNNSAQVVAPFLSNEYAQGIFKWKEKLYIPYFKWENTKQIFYKSSSDKGITWDFEAITDTIQASSVAVINNKLVTFSGDLGGFYVSDGLSGFKKIYAEGLPKLDYAYTRFVYFGGFYYLIAGKKVYKISQI